MNTGNYRTYIAIAIGAFALGVMGAWVVASHPASAQGSRALTPEGFEFSVATPIIKYHLKRDPSKQMTYKGTWIAENAEQIKPNYEIDSAEMKAGSQPVVFFNIKKPKNDWPKGLYRLEIRADGKLIRTERFVIL